MNYADSARIKAVLTNCGFSYTEDIKEADIVIFDTCSVRQKSEDKITGKLKEIWKNQKVWITGCMIQHNLRSWKLKVKDWRFSQGNFLWSVKTKEPKIVWITNEEIEKLDHRKWLYNSVFINHAFNPMFYNFNKSSSNVELFRRIDDTGFLPLMLNALWYDINYDKELINEYEYIVPSWEWTSMNNHKKTAYVPISTGCNQFCAYCIVPYARWLEKYFPVDKVVEEVKIHLKNWVEEIVLLWQIVNKHPEFVEIIKEILKLEGLRWLRYTSPYPTYYTPELLKLHQDDVKLCPHIHMPLQSGSDSVLKRMFRGYTVSDACKFIDNIRKLKRDISITTDIIVWFPDETEKDFQDSLDLIKYWKFDMVYIGIYSSRPGTLADKKYPDNVSRDIKRDRWNRLNDLLKKISIENNKKEIGENKLMLVNEILVNDEKWNKTLIWYTENMKQMLIENCKSEKINIGDFIDVNVVDWRVFKLIWEIK